MSDISHLLDDASRRQRQAADPQSSVWVGASAGTGKTKVLTDRVLTLLLSGTLPQRILCLTFTKAAAAEMGNRIKKRLGRWATASDADLAADLEKLLGRAADDDTMTGARRLFARVLDVPGGMHIETIHAFCQSLLRRFPLEAGLAPHFQVMDDRDAQELLVMARDDVLIQARDGADPTLADALATVTGLIHETNFSDLMRELSGDRGRLRRLLDRSGGLAGAMDQMAARLGLEPGDDAAALALVASQDHAFDVAGCRRAAQAMLNGSANDQKTGRIMADWLAAPPDRRAASLHAYKLAYVTAKDGTIRSQLCTKATAAIPGVADDLAVEAERIIRVIERLKSAEIHRASSALLTLGHALLAAYDHHKRARAAMDYDDLILAARDLLARPGIAPWVLYKLDGGIDHVLIDEAQDTNPDQWAVVGALTDEFFAGDGARDQVRTVFAVGDVKQSIYSFQRADPRAFEAMRAHFAQAAHDAGRKWAEIPLNLSFRSTQPVLDAVNALFAPGSPARDGVASGDDDITHLAIRSGHAGRIELWPPVEPRPADELPAWKPPIERIRGDSPQTRLARLIARRIRVMITTDELRSRGRPVRPGDVLVLVRRRGGFVEDLVRELKAQDVPVAGADRMVLTEQMAVMDLMALANFLLLPEDDLTLACLLKSPLVGLGEDELFHLAWNRGDAGLWDTLRRRMGENQSFGAAFDFLSGLLGLADRMPPHALFSHVLGPLGGKKRLLARLGIEAEDPLDEFMSLTLTYQQSHPPSLQGFLRWLETGAVEIKRDLDQGGPDAVRIMTVHGAKGLQAPIVFLPDTMQIPTQGARLLWLDDGPREILVWPPRAGMNDSQCSQGRDGQKQARDREYRRLLYVAMTRAEDRLVICGWTGKKAPPATCWYSLIRQAVAPLAQEQLDPFLVDQGETGDGRILLMSSDQNAPIPASDERTAALATALPPPDWAAARPLAEPSPPRPLAPSRPEGEEPPPRSPISGTSQPHHFLRGTLIHDLLRTVPDLSPDRRAAAMTRYLAKKGAVFDAGERLAIANEVSRILDTAGFAPLFAPGSRAEVPIVGLIGEHHAIAGQVDRLVVTDDQVLVADYKTNRRPPRQIQDIPPHYVRQMAAYRLALACVYPGRRIRCALVWTDGPRLMEIPPDMMEAVLDG